MYSMPVFLRTSEEAALYYLPRMCMYMYMYVAVFFCLQGKKYSAISLLTCLTFHVLTCCLIFKLSWKSEQPLVGKTSWENFICIYNFYLPSLPAIKQWPLQGAITIFQASKLLLPGMTEIPKVAMFVMLIWPSLRSIAFAEKKTDACICGGALNSCWDRCIPALPFHQSR